MKKLEQAEKNYTYEQAKNKNKKNIWLTKKS